MAKIKKYLPLFFTILVVLGILFLNMPVTSRQGINYEVRALKMSLYIKIMEFFDRDYHYRQIVRGIINKSDNDEKKALALFDWTCKNIRRAPQGFPVVDDHVLNIIIRGYGASDQFSDVFATLCNYAGFRAFFTRVPGPNQGPKLVLALVESGRHWYVFDPYNGAYFRNKSGGLASIQDIQALDWTVCYSGAQAGIDYRGYLLNLCSHVGEAFNRSNIQSPLRRLIYEIDLRLIQPFLRCLPSEKNKQAKAAA